MRGSRVHLNTLGSTPLASASGPGTVTWAERQQAQNFTAARQSKLDGLGSRLSSFLAVGGSGLSFQATNAWTYVPTAAQNLNITLSEGTWLVVAKLAYTLDSSSLTHRVITRAAVTSGTPTFLADISKEDIRVQGGVGQVVATGIVVVAPSTTVTLSQQVYSTMTGVSNYQDSVGDNNATGLLAVRIG